MSLFPIYSPASASVAVTTYVSTAVSDGFATAHTFSGQGIGTAFTGRKICVAAACGAQAQIISSLTVAGISGSKLVEKVSDAGENLSSMWQVNDVNTGTTGDIVVTFAGGMSRLGIVVWSIANAASSVSDTGNDGAGGTLTADIDVPANGTCIAIGATQNGQGSMTWSGVDKDVQGNLSSGSFSGGSKDFAAVQSGLTVSVVTPVSSRPSFVVASFGPA